VGEGRVALVHTVELRNAANTLRQWVIEIRRESVPLPTLFLMTTSLEATSVTPRVFTAITKKNLGHWAQCLTRASRKIAEKPGKNPRLALTESPDWIVEWPARASIPRTKASIWCGFQII
jgi:hypothetical protein